jgi:Outer membrane protein beta-barrel domain
MLIYFPKLGINIFFNSPNSLIFTFINLHIYAKDCIFNNQNPFDMKKVALIILTFTSSIFATAQIQFGVKAGINLDNITVSGLSPNSTISFSSKTNFNAGLLASVPLTSSIAVQPEIVYSGQGANSNVAGTSINNSYGYLNVPVLLKYQHTSGLFAVSGPQIGFLLSANAEAKGQPSVDIKNNTQSVDFSWSFGLGYEIKAINLGIDARYNLGLTNIEKSTYSNGTAKNSVFQFGLFYKFKKS